MPFKNTIKTSTRRVSRDTHKNTPVYELFYHFEIIIFAACKRKYSIILRIIFLVRNE